MNSKATLNAVNDDSIEVLGLCGESSARRLNYVIRLERPLGGAAAELQELRRPLIAQQGKNGGSIARLPGTIRAPPPQQLNPRVKLDVRSAG
jgi:hypothetical protein